MTHAVSMGNLDVEGGSVNGRAATGTAVTAEAIRIRQERKKQDAALISVIEQLRRTLQRMDERISQLTVEIERLTEQKGEAEARSEAAFAKMEDLESQVDDIEENGFTDTKRDALKRAIGQEAEGISNDAALLECARGCIVNEQQKGIEAHTEAQIIGREIADRIKAKDDLIKTREEIANNPTASLHQKATLADAALQRSIDEEQVVIEELNPEGNKMVERTVDAQASKLTAEDNFNLDETIPINSALTVNEPGR